MVPVDKLLCLLCLLFLSCHAKKAISYNPIQDWKVDTDLQEYYRYAQTGEFPIDSTVYRALIRIGRNPNCARLIAYAQTTMQMVKLNQAGNNFTVYEYGQCRAVLESDSIRITFNFGLYAGGSVSYFAGKPLELVIKQQQYRPSLTHTSDANSMIKVNGKWVQKPFPTSDFENTRLHLHQSSYAIGDTIKGKFYGHAHRKHPRKNELEKELIKGSFRVILEDKNEICR